MRSDSRQDLWAKSLAILGLGALGAVAAVVDTTSRPADFPFVSSPGATSSGASIQVAVDLGDAAGVHVLNLFPQPATVVRAVNVRRQDSAASEAVTVQRAQFIPRPRPRVRFTMVRDVEPLPVSVEALALPLPTINSLAPPPVDDVWKPIPMVLAAVDRADEGFFSSVLRKTSGSLGKASGALMSAVRVVGDKVKHPF